MIVLYTIAIFIWLVFPVIAYKMARQRGLNAPLYAVLTFFFSVIPMIYMAIKYPGPPLQEPLQEQQR